MGQKFVNELAVEIDTLLVDGVVPSTERDNPRPCDGEAVGADAILSEEGDILLPELVGLGREVSVLAILSLSRDLRVCVPDSWATTVDVGGPFNLEGS